MGGASEATMEAQESSLAVSGSSSGLSYQLHPVRLGKFVANVFSTVSCKCSHTIEGPQRRQGNTLLAPSDMSVDQ